MPAGQATSPQFQLGSPQPPWGHPSSVGAVPLLQSRQTESPALLTCAFNHPQEQVYYVSKQPQDSNNVSAATLALQFFPSCIPLMERGSRAWSTGMSWVAGTAGAQPCVAWQCAGSRKGQAQGGLSESASPKSSPAAHTGGGANGCCLQLTLLIPRGAVEASLKQLLLPGVGRDGKACSATDFPPVRDHLDQDC